MSLDSKLIVKNGKTFWTPVSEWVTINSFVKWEQAFRIYSNIYTRHHPHKSTELIQYNHIIHTIASTYIWENVYAYDKEFQLHLSKHPERSWSVILQQAWSMKLKDRLRYDTSTPSTSAHNSGFASSTQSDHNRTPIKSNEPCKRYNKFGKCKFGMGCKYDHKCSYCYKTGHTILMCRKLFADHERVAGFKKDRDRNSE